MTCEPPTAFSYDPVLDRPAHFPDPEAPVTGTAAGHIVRRARPEDAKACAQVYVDSWRSAYAGVVPDRVLLRMSYRQQASQWAAAIEGRTSPGRWGAIYVAESVDGEIVGVSTCGAARTPAFGCEGEIFTLYVAEDHQGLGVGRKLLCTGFAGLAAQGCPSALVWVLSANPARFFYTAMGGRKVAEQKERLWGVLLDQDAYGWDDLAGFLSRHGPCSAA